MRDSWLWNSYYVRVTRRAFADSLFFVSWKVKTGVYSGLTLGFAILAFWIIAGPEATQQRLTVVIAGLIGAGCAFSLVFVFNLVMAPIRMERELKAKAWKWLVKLNTQIKENKKAAKPAAQARLRRPLSEEAKELLLEAADDKGGHITKREPVSGIETNGRTFGEQGNPKDQATWTSAFDELKFGGLITYQNLEVYRVTRKGYEWAEALTKPDD